MIDLHAHILPGVDDGAADLYDMIEMARIAVESGVTGMVATPHCNIPGLFHNYYGEEYIEKFRKVEAVLEQEGIPLTLYAGMEVFVTPEVPKFLEEGKLLTINGSNYMLVEFAFDEEPFFMDEMLQKMKELGICPIVAHPERYQFVQEDLQIVYDWVQKGYLTQVNKGSFLGRFGRRAYHAAHGLLSHDLVTVIASDTHSPYQRTPELQEVYEELLVDYSDRHLYILLHENPLRICQNQPTVPMAPRSFLEEEW